MTPFPRPRVTNLEIRSSDTLTRGKGNAALWMTLGLGNDIRSNDVVAHASLAGG